MRGRKLTRKEREYHAQRVREAWADPETRKAHMRAAKKQGDKIRKLWASGRYAKTHSEESNRKRVAAYKRYYEQHPAEMARKSDKMRATYADGQPKKKISKALRKAWAHPVKGHNLLQGAMQRHSSLWKTVMNKPEKRLYDLLKELGYQYKWTGGGRGRVNQYIPDFMHSRFKWIVEMYGGYWHDRADIRQHDLRRIRDIRKAGYEVLIVRQSELKDIDKLVRKIKRWHSKS